MSRTAQPVMIMAGGTGGHVYPALAVALDLLRRQIPVVWMGTRKGLEARVVPEHGIPIAWLSISGLRGKGIWAWLKAPFGLLLALSQALVLMLRHNPAVVLGMGGFVAGPGGAVAALLRKPLVIHEQNAVVGLTNRLLLPLSDCALEGFPQAFPVGKATHVGNPVRSDISALEHPRTRMDFEHPRLRVLVFGGSLGATVFNEIVPQAIQQIPESGRPEVWQQVGRAHLDAARKHYDDAQVEARLDPFIDDMAAAYAWADVVLCRSGALTVAEVAAAGTAALFVPYPYHTDNQQTLNAKWLTRANAGVLIAQTEFTALRLAELLQGFARDREQLKTMAINARELSRANVAQRVASICLRAANDRRQINPEQEDLS